MKTCKECGKEVSTTAKTCPNCGRSLKKPIMKYIILGLILLIIVGSIIASNKEKARKEEFGQNEVATYKEVNYSVTDVRRTEGDQEFLKAPEGKEYVVVSLKIENKSNDKIPYNSLDWKLSDGNGDEKSYAIFGNDTNKDLNSGDLNAGGTKTGEVAYEVTKGDENLTLKYYDSLLSNERAFEFKLNK